MNHAEILSKVAKLLRLSKSENHHEAALAASRAQELIDRHKLNIDELLNDEAVVVESNEPVADFSHDPIARDKVRHSWKVRLASIVADKNQCKVYTSSGEINLVGRGSDVAATRYLFSFLVAEIERLANNECVGCGRTYWNNYRIGAVQGVSEVLAAQHNATIKTVREQAAAKSSNALIVVNNSIALLDKRAADVEAWADKNLKLRSIAAPKARYNHSARERGQQAGRNIQIGGRGLPTSSHLN